MGNMHLTKRQATILFTLFQIGSAFLLIPSTLTAIAKQDAWISVVISVGLFMLCIPIYIAIANQLQGKSMHEYLIALLGKWVGSGIMCVFVICVPILIIIMTLRNLGDFLTTSIMPETPVEIIYVLMLIAVYLIVRAGIVVIGRSVEILFIIIPFLFVLNVASLVPSMKLYNLLPVLEYGWKPVMLASFPLFGFPYLECVVFLYLVSYLKQTHLWNKAVIHSTLISGSMYLVMIIITTAVLSEGVTSNLTYSSYFVVRSISIADFIERYEILITVFWYIAIFFRLSLLLFISAHGLAEVCRLQDANPLLIPIVLFTFVMCYWIWPNTSYVIQFIQVYPWYAMVFGIIGPAMIWLLGRWKVSR
jgi:spore germination protein KB